MTDSSPEIDLMAWENHATDETTRERAILSKLYFELHNYESLKANERLLILIAEIRKRDQWIAELKQLLEKSK